MRRRCASPHPLANRSANGTLYGAPAQMLLVRAVGLARSGYVCYRA